MAAKQCQSSKIVHEETVLLCAAEIVKSNKTN